MRINTPQAHNSGMKKLNICIVLGGVLCGLHSPFTHARTTESHAGIYAAITSFVRAQVQTLGGEATIKVGEIDARLNLAACAQPEIFWPPGANMLGNSTVGVRCVQPVQNVIATNARSEKRPANKNWSLLVPVKITVITDLLITQKSLRQGQVLNRTDLGSRRGELAQTGILTDPAAAIGKVLKYSLSAGQVLKEDMLRAPFAVMQGQTVQLQVEGQGYKIISTGLALNNATSGQAVQIKTPFGQVVGGVARADGAVVVHPVVN